MHTRFFIKSPKLISLAITSLSLSVCRADFAPILLTQESYNHDLVVERTALPPLVPVTTATMDSGRSNADYTWYEKGYQLDYPASGLPPAGTITTSESVGDHEYLFAPSYRENNVVLIDPEGTTGTLTLLNPASYSVVSFLVSGGNGGGMVEYTLRHEDGSVQIGTFFCRDWLNGPNAAYTASGRVNVTSFIFDLNNTNPRLYAMDIATTNNVSPLVRIDFRYTATQGRAVVFAVSAAASAGDPVSPLHVTGYNADVVVEANSTRPGSLLGFTTASMEDGTGNAGNTWFERGYYPPSPECGLPPAGSEITSPTAPDHRYILAPSYSSNNVVLLDAANTDATMTLAIPERFSALSFLASAGHGPVTNRCIVGYANGTKETNFIVVPDWFDTSPAALCGSGRVKLNRRLVDSLNSDSPKAYSVDLNLGNASIPVKDVWLTFAGGPLNSHAAILALSGADPSKPPVIKPATLFIKSGPGGGLAISSTGAGRLQSTTQLKGEGTLWNEEGTISETTTIIVNPAEAAKFFRVTNP